MVNFGAGYLTHQEKIKMKDFVNRLQKDLSQLQKTVEKESNDLLKKAKEFANKDNLIKKGVEIEHFVEKEFKKIEPSLNKVLSEVRKNARKVGFDVDTIEKKLRSHLSSLRSKMSDVGKKPSGKSASKSSAKMKRPTTKAATKTSGRTSKPSAKKAPQKKSIPQDETTGGTLNA